MKKIESTKGMTDEQLLNFEVATMEQFKDGDAHRILYRRIYAQLQTCLTRMMDKRATTDGRLIAIASEARAYNDIISFINEPMQQKKTLLADKKFNKEAQEAMDLQNKEDMYDGADDNTYYGPGGTL